MKRTRFAIENDRWRLLSLFTGFFILLLCALPATAKMATDFNPNLDFSKYKTFAYIGGVEQLMRLQLNPELLNNRIHRSVVRELTAKGLREVSPEENPDLVVRYWIENETDARVTGSVYWGTYGHYYLGHWTVTYSTVSADAVHKGIIGVELIDAKIRDLAWRMLASEKFTHRDTDSDKIWKAADSNIKKAFKEYPPSAKDIEEKKREWAKEDAQKKPD